MLLWIWSLALAASIYIYIKNIYSKFKVAGVHYRKPWPLLGNMGGTAFRTEHITTSVQKTYNAFPNDRFIGFYEFTNPIVLLKDSELLKKIAIKDFDHFVDHRSVINSDNEPLFGRNLFAMKGDDWRDMRSTLSPAFTSSKIKLMVPFIAEVGYQMTATLKNKIKDSGVGHIELDVKDLTSRYANDVIATCAFGLKINSHATENNEFYEKGKLIINVKLFSEESKRFFIQLVTGVMREREEKNIIRPDMIQLLMEAKKGSLTHDSNPSEDVGFATVEESDVGHKKSNRVWTDIDLIAQAVLFFLAGFDTVSTTMTFLLFELAINPDIQERLLEEILDNERKTGGKVDYKSMQEMVYLDMVVSELLRLWPNLVATDRVCQKDYNLGKVNAEATEDYIIKKGETLWLPLFAIHRDPKYYPNPEKFDPERFSMENRKNIVPFSYFPFGLGPRNCIGSRFALCEVKLFVYQLIKEFKISPGPRTCLPIVLAPESINPRIKGGHWLKIEIRKQKM